MMGFKDNSTAGKERLKDAAARWLLEACILVEGQAVLLAPVDTSRLKQSIDHVVDADELAGYVGTNVDYAIYVEFGTGEFAENGGGRKGGWMYKDSSGEWFLTRGMKPKPYLRPAFRQTKGQIEALAKAIFGEIK